MALQLVQWSEVTGRYGVHDLVRDFGRGKLGEEREDGLTEMALGWYVAMADQMDGCVQSNIRIEWARTIAVDSEQSVEEIDAALLAIGLSWFEVEWFNILEGIKWAKLTERAEPAVQLFACGQVFSSLQGKRTKIFLKAGEEALAVAKKVGDRLGEANTLRAIGDVLQFLKQSQDALNRYETAIEIYRQVGDRLGEANTLTAIGYLSANSGRPLEGSRFLEQSLEIYQSIGDRWSQATALPNLAVAYQQSGKVQESWKADY